MLLAIPQTFTALFYPLVVIYNRCIYNFYWAILINNMISVASKTVSSASGKSVESGLSGVAAY